MKKVVIMIRTSTESQQVEDQRNEMILFCRGLGYTDEQMIFVETQGASAFKLDEGYLDMIERVKEHILSDPEIDCFTVWHLNRAVRNEKVFVDLKNFLIEHRVQFICKNPYLQLLNEDGTVNMGMELAFSLMATLAKQDNEERQAKFKRAKAVMRKQGKFIGGRRVKYGYKVGKDGYVVIDDVKGDIVKLVFELYASGKYSIKKLYDELAERGIPLDYHTVHKMVSDKSYYAGPYPPIITEEIWKQCEEVRHKNLLSIPKGKNVYFAAGLFKCYCCGWSMISQGARYRCIHHNKSYSAPPHCDNGRVMNVQNLDSLLWWIASKEEIMFRMKMNENKREDYAGKIEILKKKVLVLQEKLNNVDGKRKRIAEMYIDGVIDQETKEKKLNSLKSDIQTYNDTIKSHNERIGALMKLLEDNSEGELTVDKLKRTYLGVQDETDNDFMREIIRKHIKKVTAVPTWFGRDRDKRSERMNGQLITIETMFSGIQKYYYIDRKYNGHYFYWYREDGAEKPILSIKGIKG